MTDLIPREPEALAALAHQAQEDIKADLRHMRKLWVSLAAKLYDFQSERKYRALGYRSFDEWLAQPEIDLGRRNAYFHVETYKTLVVDNGVDPRDLETVNITNARAVLPAVRSREVEPDEALADARVLTVDDLRVKYQARTEGQGPIGREPIDAGSKPVVLPPERETCPACGRSL